MVETGDFASVVDSKITANLDLIPVQNWGFDKKVLETMKAQKHTLVNKHMAKAERKTISTAEKQQIARAAGGVFNTISEITMNWMHPEKKPSSNSSQPAAKKSKKDDDEVNKDVLAESTLAYSNLKFSVAGDEKKKLSKKAKRNKFTGKDYERLLDKATVRADKLDRIRETNPGKAKTIEESIQWERAMSRAIGTKVKDNVDLLKKGLKSKIKKKSKSKADWQERKKKQEGRTAHKQKKREENIKKKKTRGKNGRRVKSS
uniref:Ribosomal RNA-processing protein 14/surfeit locus protein 6 C-terminal domain-containing protein n=1 Tax=Ditylenchus dipsaci TaxID=166011 RepID=A0A915DE73_9BILA